jgi:hypothetical protein
MSEEPKGFYNASGDLVERKKAVRIKSGIVIYKGKGDH